MSEDHDALLLKIGQLAGQINRYKNQHEQIDRTSQAAYPGSFKYGVPYHIPRIRGSPYWQPSTRGGYSARGGRGRGRGIAPVAHHHKTLVLNRKPASSSEPPTDILKQSSNLSPAPLLTELSTTFQAADGSSVTKEGWVAKRDRHMQLINTSVYNQQAQSRAKAMAKTQEDEELKFNRYLQTTQSSSQEVVVGGERYRVAAGGSKLVRLTGNSDVASTPKNPIIGGVQFQRSLNGNLWRAGLVRASRMSKAAPCKYFSNTGRCKHGRSCPYAHNPGEVAICLGFLTFDSCPDGEMCDLSHEPTPHRVPACHHFLRGNCSNPNCRYAHVRVNPAAPVCRPFAILGYCPKGAECTCRHVHACPEFDETGECTAKKCKLPHVERAGKIRAAAAAEKAKAVPIEPMILDSTEDEEDEDDNDDIEMLDFNSDVDSDGLSDDLVVNHKNEDLLTKDFIKV